MLYVPGEDGAPRLKARLKYGETPEVGDVPRIGKRPGDPRCAHGSGFYPCHLCVYEQAVQYKYCSKVMPGLTSNEAAGKNPITGMPFSHAHPFRVPTSEMNTGRGCDANGKPYLPPRRFDYIKIHRFNDEEDDYVVQKEYELDWGPEIGSKEFREGSQQWQQTDAFKVYQDEMQNTNPDWRWQDPVAEKPWESVELEEPNAWLHEESFLVEEPIDQHVRAIQEWANMQHEPWPELAEDTVPAAIADATDGSAATPSVK